MRKLFTVVGLFTLAFLAWRVIDARTIRTPRVTFLDIGQGDAILVQLPGGFDILVDGGPDNTVVEKLGARLSYFDRTVELLVVTHPDADHVAGLPEVVRRYEVERVLWTGVDDDLPAYAALRDLLRADDATELLARAGQTYALPNASLTVLSPAESIAGTRPDDSNAYSVVVRLDAGERSVLLTGDADLAAEENMLASGLALTADVLKAGHHGSKTATSEAFLDAVEPRVAVISAGRENRYGHPHKEVIERLRRHGVEVISTAEVGDVCLEVKESIRACR